MISYYYIEPMLYLIISRAFLSSFDGKDLIAYYFIFLALKYFNSVGNFTPRLINYS